MACVFDALKMQEVRQYAAREAHKYAQDGDCDDYVPLTAGSSAESYLKYEHRGTLGTSWRAYEPQLYAALNVDAENALMFMSL